MSVAECPSQSLISDTVRRRRHSPGVSIYTRYVSFDSAGRQTLTAVGLSVIEV